MMVTYLVSAFSLQMLGESAFKRQGTAILLVTPVSIEKVKYWLERGFVSAVGHESTAKLLSQLLGIEVKLNRVEVKLGLGDRAYVFQLLQRLPEGKVLTEEELQSLQFKFFEVVVMM